MYWCTGTVEHWISIIYEQSQVYEQSATKSIRNMVEPSPKREGLARVRLNSIENKWLRPSRKKRFFYILNLYYMTEIEPDSVRDSTEVFRSSSHARSRIDCPPTHKRATFPGDKEGTFTDNTSVYPGCEVTHRDLAFSLHAGTHVDTPSHIRSSEPHRKECEYSGEAFVFDVRPYLNDRSRVIGADMLAPLVASLRDTGRYAIRAVLLRTGYIGDDPNQPHDPNGFPYPGEGVVEMLMAKFPKIRVIGVDTPSVDAQSEVDLAGHRHGEIFKDLAGPLEGLHFPKDAQYTRGTLDVTFDALRTGPDAIGVHASFRI